MSRSLLVLLLLVLVAAVACSSGSAGSAAPSAGTAGTRVVPHDIADLSFVDDTGVSRSLAALHGKTVVLTDFLTLCQEICPLTTANLRQVQQAVERAGRSSDIVFVEVTVDPQRDTQARLAAYRKVVGAGSNWLFLTGSPANIKSLWSWFGVAYETTPEEQPPGQDWWTGKPLTYDVGHTDAMFFLDSKGTQRYVIAGAPSASGSALPSPLATFLNDEGRNNLASPEPGSWTAADVESVLSWLSGHRISGS